jgi:hypothetical protein
MAFPRNVMIEIASTALPQRWWHQRWTQLRQVTSKV